MNVSLTFKRVLDRYGNTVMIRTKGRTEVTKAFVQPLRRRHRLYINDKVIPAGYFDNAYKLYIGDRRHRFSYGDGTVITCMGEQYTVVTGEEFIVGDDEVYVWAILSPKKECKEDDYDVID